MGSEPEARRRFQREMSLEGAERLLKPGLSFAALDAEANALSDLESARLSHGLPTAAFMLGGPHPWKDHGKR